MEKWVPWQRYPPGGRDLFQRRRIDPEVPEVLRVHQGQSAASQQDARSHGRDDQDERDNNRNQSRSGVGQVLFRMPWPLSRALMADDPGDGFIRIGTGWVIHRKIRMDVGFNRDGANQLLAIIVTGRGPARHPM